MPHRKQSDSGNWSYTAVRSEIQNSVKLGLSTVSDTANGHEGRAQIC